MKLLTVRNWTKFQHYRNRRPPWIKLATDTFQNPEFAELSDASKLLAICIWTLASRSKDGSLPASIAYIKQWGFLRDCTEEHLNELINHGFVINASVMLADCEQSAIAETETEGEAYKQETETEKNPPQNPFNSTKYPQPLAEQLAKPRRMFSDRPPADVSSSDVDVSSLEGNGRDLARAACENLRVLHVTCDADTSPVAYAEKTKPPKSPFNSTEAAKGYCDTFSVVGRFEIEDIRKAIELEKQKTGEDPQMIADRMIAARQEYDALAGKRYEWSIMNFITQGHWTRKHTWMGENGKQESNFLREARKALQNQA